MNFLSLEPFLQQYPDWRMRSGRLHRDYQFVDFVQAFGFMTQVALLTGKDIALAVAIEQLWFTRYT